MSLLDRLDDAAREARRAEIEKLLAQNAGKLLRASSLPNKPPAPVKTANLEEFLSEFSAVSKGEARVLTVRRSVSATAQAIPHKRGYCFRLPGTCEVPNRELLTRTLNLFSPDDFQDIPLERLAFVDTETTGAAGPAGTLAFLVGLGWFTQDGSEFVCEQFFVEDFHHETALLEELRDRLDNFDAFLSYNGKSFDIPLLRGRYIMNRMRIDLDRPHVDLLHAVRRIWKRRIGGCSLGAAEKEILGIERQHDVDGSLVPLIYFDYLRGLRTERLIPVFDHNAQDVISLGALLWLVSACIDDVEHCAVASPQDLLSLGRLYSARRQWDDACSFLEAGLTADPPEEYRSLIIQELIGVYRRQGRPDLAVALLEPECARNGIEDWDQYIQLLVLLERHVKDHARALDWIQRAESEFRVMGDMMKYMETSECEFRDRMAALETRKLRIIRKLSKKRAALT